MRYSLSCQLVAFVIFLWSCCLCTLYDNCLFDFAAGYCNKLQVDLKFQNQKKVFVLELVICQLIEAFELFWVFYSSVLELTHYMYCVNVDQFRSYLHLICCSEREIGQHLPSITSWFQFHAAILTDKRDSVLLKSMFFGQINTAAPN